MTASGAPGNGYEIRVATILRDIALDPGQCQPGIFDMCWKHVARAQAVIDGDTNPIASGQVIDQRQRLLRLVANGPAAAMHLQQYRSPAGNSHRGFIDIQQIAITRLAIGNIAHTLDTETRKLQQPSANSNIDADKIRPPQATQQIILAGFEPGDGGIKVNTQASAH